MQKGTFKLGYFESDFYVSAKKQHQKNYLMWEIIRFYRVSIFYSIFES